MPVDPIMQAMAEVVMDRFSDEEENFLCVPIILGEEGDPSAMLISFVFMTEVTHVTEEGTTIIPADSGITMAIQEWVTAAAGTEISAHKVFDLKRIT
jgi:hypothetical protein